jgi:hypothetical protein
MAKSSSSKKRTVSDNKSDTTTKDCPVVVSDFVNVAVAEQKNNQIENVIENQRLMPYEKTDQRIPEDEPSGATMQTVESSNATVDVDSSMSQNYDGSKDEENARTLEVEARPPESESYHDTKTDQVISQVNSKAVKTESSQDDSSAEEEEQWELSHVFSIDELCQTENAPQVCMTKKCPLLACVSYVSNLDKDYIWHSCIDCQEKDYGGWPENLNEIPIKFMTKEHRQIMLEKCTGQYAPSMPNLPIDENGNLEEPLKEDESADTDFTSEAIDQSSINAQNGDVSPPDNNTADACVRADTSSDTQTKKSQASTPLPTSLNIDENDSSSKSFVTPSPAPLSNKSKGLSKAAIANHEKWRNECLKLGGTGKICVKKPEIKKMIFDLCKDSFAPMNITQIYNVSEPALQRFFKNQKCFLHYVCLHFT